jgi:hypothetical protein
MLNTDREQSIIALYTHDSFVVDYSKLCEYNHKYIALYHSICNRN